jgi:hypothetical protein
MKQHFLRAIAFVTLTCCVIGCNETGDSGTGPMCMTGKRCGNTCISRDKTCHIGDPVGSLPGTASSSMAGVGGSTVTSTNTVGDPCQTDADCSSPGLTPFCTPDSPSGGECSAVDCLASPCGTGNACISAPPQSGISGGICFRRCSTSADCRAGYECNAYTHQPDDLICLPEL